MDTTDRKRLIRLLDEGHEDDPNRFRDIPADVTAETPTGWLWRPGAPVHPAARFGLRDPEAYVHVLPDGRDPRHLYRSPAAALAQADPAQAYEYVRHSVDLTMKGGTTSGVVYPVAACEIARRAVLRNIGGASAGAIAAAGSAAAELGRSYLVDKPLPRTRPEDNDPAWGETGRVRAGFAGLADVTAWLAEADADDGPDLHRLGQLFRPAPGTRAVFRVIVAVMLRQFAIVPLLLVGALGWITRLVTVALLVLGPALVTGAAAQWRGAGGYLLAAAWLIVLSTIGIGGPVCVVLMILRARPRTTPGGPLSEPVRLLATPAAPPIWPGVAAVAAGVVIGGVLLWKAPLPPWWSLVATWLAVLVGVIMVQAASIVRIVFQARKLRFGLVPGAAHDRTPLAQGVEPVVSVWDKLAGMPLPTVRPALMDWLNNALNDLAGLPEGEVLRFGHLWQGTSFSTAPDVEFLDRAAAVPEERLINLQLMTSELVHGVPLRFPLSVGDVRNDQHQQLMFVRKSDLTSSAGQLLPDAVINAICAGERRPPAKDARTGKTIDDLYPMPLPWDLPVLFAVRMSMALPMLFQAVRLYRAVQTSHVRESFGVRLAKDGTPLQYPAEGGPWVEELWLSDGGITSNFPIHFFDSVLPRWPTLGINLGNHPPGAAHQDVWLPSDVERVETPSKPINGSLLSFLAGILNTGLNWRDAAQTVMPAYLGRVATVRMRSDEGGTNLYMGREQVAALAVRGATAGVRLSRRFSTEAHWQRHQYLRTRVGLGNLANLSRSVDRALSEAGYAVMVTDGPGFLDAVIAALATVADPNPPQATDVPNEEQPTPWFDPSPELWSSAEDMLLGVAARETAGLGEGVPQPSPELKQVPRL